jgi:predicted Co/Zn/Cd cation transporter (cation efflux family)
MDGTHYEQRSLTAGMWANLVMGVAGVTAAQLSNSDALLVDGLYSGVNFFSAIIAGKVAASVMRRPDQKYPFGYEANDSLYVLFRSLVLLGILAFAAFNSINKIVTYARGGEVPELIFGPITIYMFSMIALCFGLAAWHGYNWRKTGKRSEILKTERTASIVDGFISAGAGGALLGVTLLRGTPLDVIIPVADAIVVLVLATVMIGQPAGMLRSAIREVAGRAVDDEATTTQVRERIEAVLDPLPGELLRVAITKLGRFHFVVSYIKPTGSVTATDLDTLRGELHKSYADLFSQVRTEVVFTAEAPYH